MSWRRGCTAVALAALWLAPAAAATDSTAVYTDFASDGKLSCRYSRADLEATLHGDPYTTAGLKVAIRRQLAGGCANRSGGAGGLRSNSTLIGVGALLLLLGAGGWFAKRSLGNPR
jgi:hypothetical protein